MREARLKGWARLFITFALGVVILAPFIPGVLYVLGATGGVEFALVDVWMPMGSYGQLGVYAFPFNVSDPSMLSFSNLYVVDQQGNPYYSYLFSNSPPFAVWVDGAAATKTYSIFYGGANPYPEYIATPGGQVPLFAAYDDFDYDTGLWNVTGSYSLGQSQMQLQGRATLNTSYTPGVLGLWLVRFGERGSAIQLYSPTGYTGWLYLRLDASNFGDWDSIVDGSDIYFTDQYGNPLNYTVARLDKTIPVADILVYAALPAGSTTIYMHYGGTNPYPQYRTAPTTKVQAADITPRAKPTTLQTAEKITGYKPTPTTTLTLNLTNITVAPGDTLAPHLYDWSFDGVDDWIEYAVYNWTRSLMTLEVRVKLFGYNSSEAHTFMVVGAGGTAGNPYAYLAYHWSIKSTQFVVHNGTDLISLAKSDSLTNDNTYHVVRGVFDYGETSLWIDNTKIVSGTAVFSTVSSQTNHKVRVGRQGWWGSDNYPWYGLISYTLLTASNRSTTTETVIYNTVFLLDPTFYNGTHYFDLVSGANGIPYGGVARAPANETWLWLVKGLVSDGFVHLRFFPAGSIVRFYDASSGVLVGVVRVWGLANGAGLVPDVAVPLPGGNYTVVVDTYVGAGSSSDGWFSSVWTGLARMTGTGLSGHTTGETVRTANGGTLYVEYSDATGYGVAWYQPGPHTGAKEDYTTPDQGWTPFPQYNDYTSTTNLKEVSIPLNNLTITQNITIQGGELIAPHLYDWDMDGVDDYIRVAGSDSLNITQSITLLSAAKYRAFPTSAAVGYIGKGNAYVFGTSPETKVGGWIYDAGSWHGSWVISATVLETGRLYHVGFTYDGSKMSVYINGSLDGILNYAGDIDTSTNPVDIGHWVEYLNGYLLYAIIYNRSLTDTEITTLYSQRILNASELKLFLDPTFYNGTHYIDISGYNNHGTPYGGIQRTPSNETWLWVIQGLYSGGVRLAWFPLDAFVVFRNATTGEVVASTIVPAGQEGTVVDLPPGNYTVTAKLLPPTSYRRITQTLTINPNDTIAPHLYDWYFDGVDDFVEIYAPSVFNTNISTILGAAKNIHDYKQMYILRYDTRYALRWDTTDKVQVFAVNASSYTAWIRGSTTLTLGKWYELAARINITNQVLTLEVFVDGVFDGSGTWQNFYMTSTDAKAWIGAFRFAANKEAEFSQGTVAYMLFYDSLLSNSEITQIHNDRTVPTPTLFFDATFYNGTYYFDLVNSIVGTPYGGVQRVPANQSWLWRITGLYSDNLVHFRFIPVGTIIRLYDSSGNLKYVFYVGGPGNAAGLVEDYAVSIGAGTYTVEMLVPDWGSSEASVSLAAVSYSGSRDGYSLQLQASFDLPSNDTLVAAAVGVVDTPLYMFDSNSKAYQAVYAWGLSPVVDVGFNTSLATVFEARLHSDAGWYVGVLDAYGGLWTLAGVYGLGGKVYLYDGFSDALVDTNISYPENDWLYVYLKLAPDGTVTVGVGNGTYAAGGIYEDITTYTYAPPTWEPSYVAFAVGVASTASGTYTLYVDWARVRVEAVSGFTLASGWSLEPVVEERYLPSTGGGNWTLYLDVSGLEGLSLTLPAVNNSYTVEFGEWQDAFGTDAYVAGSASVSVRITNASGDILALGSLDSPSSGTLVVGYNGSYLYVGLDVSNSYTEIAAAPVTDRFLGVGWLWYAGSVSPLFLHNDTARMGTFVSSAPAVVPSPGAGSYFKIGYIYKPSNTTYVEWGVEVNGSSLGLFVDVNGTVDRFPLGIAATPMVLGVGYSFDNSTGRLTVYALASWLESAGGTPYTRWTHGYLEVESSIPVEWGTPFADSGGGILLIDRFGLTLGGAMEQVVRGASKAVLSGPYPVGGLVKYVSINQPIKIRLAGGNIVVEPSNGPSTITLEGFQGWTLDLALYGTSTTNIMISSDPYSLDFPTGFTAVIVADISARKLSIVSANPPPQVGGGRVQEGQALAPVVVAAPKFTAVFDPPAVLNEILLAAALVAGAVAASRLTGHPADGVAVAGFVAAVVLLLVGDYVNFTVAMLVVVVALGARVALRS